MRKSAYGFTLIELLVVVTILGILAVMVWLTINPVELKKRANDTTRLSDLASLKQAITVALSEQTGDKLVCNGTDLACHGNSNPGSAAKKAADGSGWVRIDVKSQKSVSMPTLPLDPINDTAYHYTYCGVVDNGTQYWEIDTVLESQQEKGRMLNSNDGGNEDDKYEIGSSLTAIAPEGQGSCTY